LRDHEEEDDDDDDDDDEKVWITLPFGLSDSNKNNSVKSC